MNIPPKSGLKGGGGKPIAALDKIGLWKVVFIAFVAYFLMAFIFAVIYVLINETGSPVFSQLSTQQTKFVDCLYFSVVTQSTLGYGDVAPIGWAKSVAILQTFLGILLSGALLGVIIIKITRPSYHSILLGPNLYYSKDENLFYVRIANNSNLELKHIFSIFNLFVGDRGKESKQTFTANMEPKNVENIRFNCWHKDLIKWFAEKSDNWTVTVSVSVDYGFGTLIKTQSYSNDSMYEIKKADDIDLDIIKNYHPKASFKELFYNQPQQLPQLFKQQWLIGGQLGLFAEFGRD